MPEPRLFHCRAGFEADCALEIEQKALEAGSEGEAEYEPGQAYVIWRPVAGRGRSREPHLQLVFARAQIYRLRALEDLRAPDRVTPVVEAARALAPRFSSLWVEAPDSEPGRKLLATVRNLAEPIETELRARAMLAASQRHPRLHVCFVERERAYVGVSDLQTGSPWPMGIPRLRSPAGAPSRSGMKLVEALATFVGEASLIARMRPGRVAVDLGAAPGGWSQVLASRGMRVIAVDNGPIAREVLATQLVEHRREDAFRFRPERPVDWMVCDVVAAPARIAALAAQWIARGWCREAIFNLKLPNRARWQEIVRCQKVIERALAQVSGEHELNLRHLYHDREEVTAHLRRR